MSYTSKQAARESHTAEQQGAKPSAQLFSDQRSSTSAQLKQQHMMGAVQRMGAEEEEPLQGKFATLQRAEEEELLQGKFATAQLMEEEEPIQGKFDTLQRASAEEEEPLQGKFNSTAPAQLEQKPNNTGLPDKLKSGIENMSGYSMDDVKVHYNSDRPAQLNAHAYAQGTDIHVAPGQEQHLPHEAWHVVQQKQGRVQATMQMKAGVPVNDDAGLENEADVMGAKAINIAPLPSVQRISRQSNTLVENTSNLNQHSMVQLQSSVDNQEQTLTGKFGTTGKKYEMIAGKKMTAILDPLYPMQGSEPASWADDVMYKRLKSKWSEVFIKGHLLNDNLGGLGIAENLFPITSKANHAHLLLAEEPVKSALINLDKRVSDNPSDLKGHIEYIIETTPVAQNNFINNPASKITYEANQHVEDSSSGMTEVEETPILVKQEIPSDPGQPKIEGFNEKLEEMGWGSVGSGMRSKTDKMKLVDDQSTGGYYHVEYVNNKGYQKWEFDTIKGQWALVKSDNQSPIKISEE